MAIVIAIAMATIMATFFNIYTWSRLFYAVRFSPRDGPLPMGWTQPRLTIGRFVNQMGTATPWIGLGMSSARLDLASVIHFAYLPDIFISTRLDTSITPLPFPWTQRVLHTCTLAKLDKWGAKTAIPNDHPSPQNFRRQFLPS